MKVENQNSIQEQHLTRNYLNDLFLKCNIKIDTVSFERTTSHNQIIAIINRSSARNLKQLELSLFKEGVDYSYKNPANNLPFYTMDYRAVCKSANTDWMIDLNEWKDHLKAAPNFNSLGFDVPYLEYIKITRLKGKNGPDFIHSIYSHKSKGLIEMKVKLKDIHTTTASSTED